MVDLTPVEPGESIWLFLTDEEHKLFEKEGPYPDGLAEMYNQQIADSRDPEERALLDSYMRHMVFENREYDGPLPAMVIRRPLHIRLSGRKVPRIPALLTKPLT